MTLGIAVGKRIKELLLLHNKTQYRLAKESCLNEKTISDLVKGKSKDVKLSTIYLIAESFNMTPLEFLQSELLDSKNIEY